MPVRSLHIAAPPVKQPDMVTYVDDTRLTFLKSCLRTYLVLDIRVTIDHNVSKRTVHTDRVKKLLKAH